MITSHFQAERRRREGSRPLSVAGLSLLWPSEDDDDVDYAKFFCRPTLWSSCFCQPPSRWRWWCWCSRISLLCSFIFLTGICHGTQLSNSKIARVNCVGQNAKLQNVRYIRAKCHFENGIKQYFLSLAKSDDYLNCRNNGFGNLLPFPPRSCWLKLPHNLFVWWHLSYWIRWWWCLLCWSVVVWWGGVPNTIVNDCTRPAARSKQNCAKAQIIDTTSLLHCFYFCPQLAWSRSKFLCLCYSTSLGDNCVERNNELTDLGTWKGGTGGISSARKSTFLEKILFGGAQLFTMGELPNLFGSKFAITLTSSLSWHPHHPHHHHHRHHHHHHHHHQHHHLDLYRHL